jgi:hypothetical protein
MDSTKLHKWQPADLTGLEATDAEQAVAAKYTRIQPCITDGWPDAHTAWLVVEHQSFRFGYTVFETAKEASAYCWLLAKALLRVIELEADVRKS